MQDCFFGQLNQEKELIPQGYPGPLTGDHGVGRVSAAISWLPPAGQESLSRLLVWLPFRTLNMPSGARGVGHGSCSGLAHVLFLANRCLEPWHSGLRAKPEILAYLVIQSTLGKPILKAFRKKILCLPEYLFYQISVETNTNYIKLRAH